MICKCVLGPFHCCLTGKYYVHYPNAWKLWYTVYKALQNLIVCIIKFLTPLACCRQWPVSHVTVSVPISVTYRQYMLQPYGWWLFFYSSLSRYPIFQSVISFSTGWSCESAESSWVSPIVMLIAHVNTKHVPSAGWEFNCDQMPASYCILSKDC